MFSNYEFHAQMWSISGARRMHRTTENVKFSGLLFLEKLRQFEKQKEGPRLKTVQCLYGVFSSSNCEAYRYWVFGPIIF